MATVTHYIYSHYTPDSQHEDNADPSLPDEADPWRTEFSFGLKRYLAGPCFVPAVISYEEMNNMIGLVPKVPSKPEVARTDSVASWYKSLIGRGNPAAPTVAEPLPTSSSHRNSPSPLSSSRHTSPKSKMHNTNDWFSQTRNLNSVSSPIPSLADILSRDPPPSRSEKSFQPPVFLALGPNNRGFAMLQRSGWNEGEPLGPGVVRRNNMQMIPKVKQEELTGHCPTYGENTATQHKEIIDLTFSDSESEDGVDDYIGLPPSPVPSNAATASSHNGKALLTPIATVLKSDRLGIGLKAKTYGPYKASKKRVTHNQAALAAHIRASEEMKKTKKMLGRGSRSFARQAKADSEGRRRLLASLNEP